MPGIQIPSFPVPGRNRREAEEDDAAIKEEEDDEQAKARAGREGEVDDAAGSGEPPEMLDVIEKIEEAKGDVAALVAAMSDLYRRLRLTPKDRDLFSDFEGCAHLCSGLAAAPVEWKGEAMLAFCKVVPEICRTSNLNRGALREGGVIEPLVTMLREAVTAEDEVSTAAACVGITALCTANDGNKKDAAKLRGDFNDEELAVTNADYNTPLFKAPEGGGALDILLEALATFPKSVAVQTQACGALRTLLCDDDTRQASCVPSAVENRERAVKDEFFPAYRLACQRALQLDAGDPSAKPSQRLREQAMLLLRELAVRQDRIKQLVYEAKFMPVMEAALKEADERLVRAALAVIRAFAFSDELKEVIAVETDVAARCVVSVRKHAKSAAIVEQGFGLFANLTMRKPHIATKLNGGDFRVFAVGQMVLQHHKNNPNVIKSVLQTMRNVATQDETAATEVKESDLIEDMRQIVLTHGEDGRWRSPVEIAKQFLREFRMDDGIRKAAEWNEYY
jgi:hypothetical protein|mmetsp:Transcript_46768/g.138163  ORF Transcript_46768/g.138163 Transcript_46768/m.138163 type:complete len:508 (-) Transcript_46768:222-1745(-)